MSKRVPFKLRKPLYLQNDEVSIEAGVLMKAKPQEELIVPEGVIGLTRASLVNTKKLITPTTFIALPVSAFMGLALEEIDLSKSTKLERIPQMTFGMTNNLRKVILPEGLKSIEDRAFSAAKALKEIHIPNSVKHIAPSAFAVSSIDKITSHQPEELKKLMSDSGVPRHFVDAVIGV